MQEERSVLVWTDRTHKYIKYAVTDGWRISTQPQSYHGRANVKYVPYDVHKHGALYRISHLMGRQYLMLRAH